MDRGDAADTVKQVKVSKTGNATANSGGYANSGVHVGDVYTAGGPVVESHYLRNVELIAPRTLLGRESELAELAGFCVAEATAGRYLWWQARAWAGKSALMSWFVLHPPDGVRIVSFFVTARQAYQNNRAAFINNVRDQLLALLGRAQPQLTDSTQEAFLRELFAEAAELCRIRGEKFVLVVDGLDEDRGVTVSPNAYSIAALLPAPLPSGMRVIVTGRPHPPIPRDVPKHHPLRDNGIVRPLASSAHAEVVREDMERELKHLVQGTEPEQNLLGLLAAANGGLTGSDLFELTGLSEWQIDDHLRAVTGRSFQRRNGTGTGPDAYLLGHEELQVMATEMMGPQRLAHYRRLLHDWADGYRRRSWPTSTPEYLLSDYFGMLLSTGDMGRMVGCATNLARQDRVLDLAGGDDAALTEINSALEFGRDQRPPDLEAMLKLAIHRDHLRDRNAELPTGLPAVWAVIGRTNRAIALARSIPNPVRRSRALALVGRKLAAAGQAARSPEVLTEAEAAACGILDLSHRVRELASVARAMAVVGISDRALKALAHAETEARKIADPDGSGEALRWVVEAMAAVGQRTHSMEVLSRAETVARTIVHNSSGSRSRALTSVVKAMAVVGERTRSLEAVSRAETVARTIAGADPPCDALSSVVQALATLGRLGVTTEAFNRAESLIGIMIVAHDYGRAVKSLVLTLASMGELDRASKVLARAEAKIRPLDSSEWSVLVLGPVAEATAAIGQIDRAVQMLTRAETSASSVRWSRLWNALTASMVAVGRHAGSAEFLRWPAEIPVLITDSVRRNEVRALVARALIAVDERDWAIELLDEATADVDVSHPYAQGRPLLLVARAMAALGESDRADVVARSILDDGLRGQALLTAVRTLAVRGRLDQAETIARSITDDQWKGRALVAVARVAARVGEPDRAADLLTQAEAAAHAIAGFYRQSDGLAEVARVAAVTGDIDGALALAQSITNGFVQCRTFVLMAEAMVGRGRPDQAAGLLTQAEIAARTISEPSWRSEALVSVANAMAALGHFDQAVEAFTWAESTARTITSNEFRKSTLVLVARAMAAAGMLDRAETLARSEAGAIAKGEALMAMTMTTAAAGDFAKAETFARSITDDLGTTSFKDRAFASVAESMAAAAEIDAAIGIVDSIRDEVQRSKALVSVATVVDNRDRAAGLLERARTAVSRSTTGVRDEVLACITRAMVSIGDDNKAEIVARSIFGPVKRAEALASMAVEMAARGRIDEAVEVLDRVESYAKLTLHDYPIWCGQTLTSVARAMGEIGRVDRSVELLVDAETATHHTPDADGHHASKALAGVARAMGMIDSPDRAARILARAESIAHSIANATLNWESLVSVARAMAEVGRVDRSVEVLGHAETVACGVAEADERRASEELARMAREVAAIGRLDQAGTLLGKAEARARDISDTYLHASALWNVVRIAIAAGDLDRAERVARSISGQGLDSELRGLALVEVAEAVAAEGDFDRAESIAQSIAEPDLRNKAVVLAVRAVAGTGTAAELLDRAETLANRIDEPDVRCEALASAAEAMISAGESDRAAGLLAQAEALADATEERDLFAHISWPLVRALIAFGDLDRAKAAAEAVIEWDYENAPLMPVAQAMAAAGEFEQAAAVADHVFKDDQRSEALVSVVRSLVHAGRLTQDTELLDRAEAMIGVVSEAGQWSEALVSVVEGLVDTGRPVRAGELVDRAEAVALARTVVEGQGRLLKSIADAFAAAGATERAEAVARSITEPDQRDEALRSVAEAMAAAGQLERAETVALAINDPERQSQALIPITQGPDPVSAERAMARILTLSRWHDTLDTLSKAKPDVLPNVIGEIVRLAALPTHATA